MCLAKKMKNNMQKSLKIAGDSKKYARKPAKVDFWIKISNDVK